MAASNISHWEGRLSNEEGMLSKTRHAFNEGGATVVPAIHIVVRAWYRKAGAFGPDIA